MCNHISYILLYNAYYIILYEKSEGIPEWQAPQSAEQLGTASGKGGKGKGVAICFSQALTGCICNQ